jgi:hypothetical protein
MIERKGLREANKYETDVVVEVHSSWRKYSDIR